MRFGETKVFVLGRFILTHPVDGEYDKFLDTH